ncbi:MAG: hypothetical protein AUI14_19520 [Actinobacteria bacterium 13_2_20CM_2_71_6]|nr:MAG: hypothetical protein AUI14_19520 [Actinobacteria bacterium 13_2_20CM_2_71_6]
MLVVLLLAGCAPAPPGTPVTGPATAGPDTAPSSPHTSAPAAVEVHLTCTTGNPDAPCVFRPADVSIRAGGTVRWVNDDATYHTVTSTGSLARRVPDGRFNAILDTVGATFTYTFTRPGGYPYYCQPHAEFMTGTVHVL